MNSILLEEDEAYDLLEKPFNPPIITSQFTEDRFSVEWWGVRSRLKELLDQFGDHHAYGEADYNLGETLALSRGIGVEVTSSKMHSPRLIPQVQKFLASLPEKYEIDFAILTEDGISHVFVSANLVRYWCPVAVQKALGL